MWCEAQFAKFDEKLRLDKGRRERILSALRGFETACEQDSQLKAALAEQPFLQGSVPTNTAIRPLGNDEYDVDVIYPFKLSAFQSAHRGPRTLFDWFVSRMKANTTYQGRMTVKNRCVRINYAGDFHMDVIPSTREVPANQPYSVFARDLSEWITNDPRGYVGWLLARDKQSGLPDAENVGVLVRSIRIMKRWRDQFFGSDPRPSSILLTTILGKHEASQQLYNPPLQNPLFPSYRNTAAYLYDLLRLTHDCVQRPGSNPFEHPTIPGEDLRRQWDSEFNKRFLDRLAATIEYLRVAIYDKSESSAIDNYVRAFGETFPRG